MPTLPIILLRGADFRLRHSPLDGNPTTAHGIVDNRCSEQLPTDNDTIPFVDVV